MKVVKVMAAIIVVLLLAVVLVGAGCGSAGPQGPTGAQGPAGSMGDTGATGAQGPAGPKGDTGATGAQGPAGPKGDTGATGAVGAQGPKGDKGDTGAAGGVGAPGTAGTSGGWSTSTTYGPIVLSIGTSHGDQSISSLSPGDKVSYSFSVTGSSVYYWVRDPYNNIILIGNGTYSTGSASAMSGAGAFIAAASGTYKLSFSSTGTFTPSVLTINYTIAH